MTVTTFYAETGDGCLESIDATYTTAADGTGSVSAYTAISSNWVGQRLFSTYWIYEYFAAFDTSSLGASATISAVDFALYCLSDGSTTDADYHVGQLTWGTLTTGDWQDRTELSALTERATINTSTLSAGAYNTFTEGTGFDTIIELTGTTELIVWCALHEAGTAPTNQDWWLHYHADQAGTSQDPKLTITYTVPATDIESALVGGKLTGPGPLLRGLVG